MAIAQVAVAHDAVTDLLTVTMKDRAISARRITRMIITETLDTAVKTGKIARHLIADLDLYDAGPSKRHADFVFPSHAQVARVADRTTDAKGRKPAGGRAPAYGSCADAACASKER